MILSNVHEELKSTDFGKYEVPSDKIRVNEEPYETFFLVWNKKDAQTFIREFNKLAEKYFGIKYLLVYRKHVQNGVFYDIYQHRWCVLKDGKQIEDESWHTKAVENGSWEKFKREVNEKFGKVYVIQENKNG